MVDVNRLRVFRAVVASGSVASAAGHLGYTPSAISQHLAALQKETRLTLVERRGRGIVPTAAGLELAERSDELMRSMVRLDGAIDDLRTGRSEVLTVSTFASAAQEWMAPIAAQVLAQYPQVQLTFRLNEGGAEVLQSPDIDLRSEQDSDEIITVSGYDRHVLAVEPYVALLPIGHPLAGRDSVRMAELAQEPWIDDDPGRTACSRILGNAARAAGFTPRFIAQSGDHHGAIAFAAAGVGVAVMPRLAALGAPPSVVRLAVTDPTPQRRIVVLVRRETRLAEPVQRVLELLTARCAAVDAEPVG